MRNLQQSRMQAAIELLDFITRKEIADTDEKYKAHTTISWEQINEVLVVAGADAIKLERELEVVE